MKSITTCLMFVGDQAGKAEQAMGLYTSLFHNSDVISVDRYGPGEDEPEGLIKLARFTLNGVALLAMDSSLEHRFSFTPAMSLFVECDSDAEIEKVYHGLSEAGQTLMPLNDYGFSQKFGWLNDRYGVSWQLNLTA